MKELYNKYLNSNIKLERWQTISILALIIVFSGFFGFVYEYIFYFFNFGMKKFYWQGGNFLPWINIYAYGALIIICLTRKYKKNPLMVFLLSLISTGILEYISGFAIYKLFNGLRLWNYNTEILNFGNIGGFVCLRSVLFFGISGLFLIYVVLPLMIMLTKRSNKKVFLTIIILLCSIVLFDELYNLIFARVLNLPRATAVYKALGMNIMKY